MAEVGRVTTCRKISLRISDLLMVNYTYICHFVLSSGFFRRRDRGSGIDLRCSRSPTGGWVWCVEPTTQFAIYPSWFGYVYQCWTHRVRNIPRPTIENRMQTISLLSYDVSLRGIVIRVFLLCPEKWPTCAGMSRIARYCFRAHGERGRVGLTHNVIP